MKLFLFSMILSGALAAGNLHATAECESINSNVLGIRSLNTCDIGLTNYGSTPISVSQAMVREIFPTLAIEDPKRAQAVGDKAFASSTKSKIISAIDQISPFIVALIPGGTLGLSGAAAAKAAAGVSLFNTTAQRYKQHLISLQPDENAFLPNLPAAIVLQPYGTMNADGTPAYSGVWTVLGSLSFQGPVVAGAKKMARLAPQPPSRVVVQVDIPPMPTRSALPAAQRVPADADQRPALELHEAAVESAASHDPASLSVPWAAGWSKQNTETVAVVQWVALHRNQSSHIPFMTTAELSGL